MCSCWCRPWLLTLGRSHLWAEVGIYTQKKGPVPIYRTASSGYSCKPQIRIWPKCFGSHLELRYLHAGCAQGSAIGRIITEALAPGSPKLLNIYFEGIQELLPRTAIRILCVKCCSSDRRQNNKTKDCITQRAFQRRSFLFYSHLVALRCDG